MDVCFMYVCKSTCMYEYMYVSICVCVYLCIYVGMSMCILYDCMTIMTAYTLTYNTAPGTFVYRTSTRVSFDFSLPVPVS